MRKEVELLEDHAHLASYAVQVCLLVCKVCSLEYYLSARRHLEHVHASEQCALAGARRSDYYHTLALVYMQVDPLQHLKIAEVFLKSLNVYHSEPASFQVS